MFIKIKKTNKGFSLVEMLVAIGVFMSIMTIAVSALISIMGANKKAQSIKTTIDSVTFAVEDISRDMRSGTDYRCSSDGKLFSSTGCSTSGSKIVRYTNNSGDTVTYTFNGKQSDGSIGVLTKTDSSGTVDLISQDSDVNLTDMLFYIIGSNSDVSSQPRVIITASGLISVKGSNDTSFSLQTGISQRARR